MDDPQTFITVHTAGVGLTLAHQSNAIITQGFHTCSNLMSTSEDDVKMLLVTIERDNQDLPANQVVRINMSMRNRLLALREEFIMRDNCGAKMTLTVLIN